VQANMAAGPAPAPAPSARQRVHVCACSCVRVHMCVRACVRARVHVCVHIKQSPQSRPVHFNQNSVMTRTPVARCQDGHVNLVL
jgi:hypothetical protein